MLLLMSFPWLRSSWQIWRMGVLNTVSCGRSDVDEEMLESAFSSGLHLVFLHLLLFFLVTL